MAPLRPEFAWSSNISAPIPPTPGTVGHKVTFPSGAERGSDAIKGWHMLSQIALRRYCDAMQEGATKYAPFNYLKGIPVTNLWEHMMTHLSLFLQGDATEDHLGHALWNLATIIHFSETRLELFEGLPPGCLQAMIEFLQHTDEGSDRSDALPQPISSSREETPAPKPDAPGPHYSAWLEDQQRHSFQRNLSDPSPYDVAIRDLHIEGCYSGFVHQGWTAAFEYLINLCKQSQHGA